MGLGYFTYVTFRREIFASFESAFLQFVIPAPVCKSFDVSILNLNSVKTRSRMCIGNVR